MSDTSTPSDEHRTDRQGFILDDGPCCHRCINRLNEDICSLPWRYEGEHNDCIRCKGKFVNVG